MKLVDNNPSESTLVRLFNGSAELGYLRSFNASVGTMGTGEITSPVGLTLVVVPF